MVSSEGGNGDLQAGLRSVREVAIKVESVAAFSAGPRPGPGDRRATRWARTGSAGCRARRTTARGGRAARLPRVRAVPGRPGPRGPDEAARGARRPGRARPLGGAAAAVRRRRRGVRRDRGDPRPRDRAGRLARPGLPPGLRGRARLLAVAQPAARVQKARQDRLGPGLGEPRPPHLPLLAAVLPARHRHVRARSGFVAPRAVPRRRARRLGCPDPRAPDRPASSSSPTSTSPPRRPTHDFAHEALPDLPRPNTVGLWVGLHGESILEAGMHHLEAQFDFDAPARRPQGRGRASRP